jgi:hypothetical protein
MTTDQDNNHVAHEAGQITAAELAEHMEEGHLDTALGTITARDTVREDISHKLLLHCGSHAVNRAALDAVVTPERTSTWQPIPHTALIDQVELALRNNNLTVVGEAHSLTKAGNRYFGLFQIQNGAVHDDYAWILGLRNSHDKSFPAGLVAGASVFVCDNLSFSGEVRVFRKHTVHIFRDMPYVVQRGIGQLMNHWHSQDQRINAYKNTALDDMHAHDLLVRALEVGACTSTQLPHVLADWRKPRHEEFAERNVWSMMNCFTEVLKGSLNVLPNRTLALHGLFDNYVGLNSLS